MAKFKRMSDYPGDWLDPSLPTGLILAGMGGPDGPDSVEPFLRNLFRDPAVLPMPSLVARFVGSRIVKKRLARVQARYRGISSHGGSPQLSWTKQQADCLAHLLRRQGYSIEATVAMRYWHPFPEEAVRYLKNKGVWQFMVVPAYPQFAYATSGSTLQAVERAIRKIAGQAGIHFVPEWHSLPGYINALAERAETRLRSWAEKGAAPETCALLCVAHSLPERFLKQGDPYLKQTRETLGSLQKVLAERFQDRPAWWSALMGGADPLLAFQSKVGPVKWLGPEVKAEVARLAGAGCRSLLLLPISFTCEHIETLYELDQEVAEFAREAGIRTFARATALNLDGGWLGSLAALMARSCFRESRSPVKGANHED